MKVKDFRQQIALMDPHTLQIQKDPFIRYLIEQQFPGIYNKPIPRQLQEAEPKARPGLLKRMFG
jgi:hypothetical protein